MLYSLPLTNIAHMTITQIIQILKHIIRNCKHIDILNNETDRVIGTKIHVHGISNLYELKNSISIQPFKWLLTTHQRHLPTSLCYWLLKIKIWVKVKLVQRILFLKAMYSMWFIYAIIQRVCKIVEKKKFSHLRKRTVTNPQSFSAVGKIQEKLFYCSFPFYQCLNHQHNR